MEVTAVRSVSDAEVAIAIAEAGATVVRHGLEALSVWTKAQRDFATSAAIEAANAMLAMLRQQRPSDAVLARRAGAPERQAARRWLL